MENNNNDTREEIIRRTYKIHQEIDEGSKATLNRLSESDGTSEEIGEILMSKSYDARSFLRPGVHRNMSERHVIYLCCCYR